MYKGIIPGIMMVIYSVDGFYGLPMHFTNLTGVAHKWGMKVSSRDACKRIENGVNLVLGVLSQSSWEAYSFKKISLFACYIVYDY